MLSEYLTVIRQSLECFCTCGKMDVMLTDLTDVTDDCTDSECLGSMTLETQDIYLRLDSLHRRSGLRLARIIARQQLLKRISQGMRGALGNGYILLCFFTLHTWR